MLTWDEQQELDRKHLASPTAGDYWEEMYSPVLVVVGRHDDSVVICDTKKSVGSDHWTWDLRHLKTVSLEDFAGRLRYGGTGAVADKTWCHVHPGAHAWVRDSAMSHFLGTAS